MTLEKQIEAAIEMVSTQKVQLVAKGWSDNDEDIDISPMCLGFRNDAPVVMLVGHPTGIQEIVRLAYYALVFFSCDPSLLTTEGWKSTDIINPITNLPWSHGELEDVAKNHDGIAKGYIQEGLTSSAINREGESLTATKDFMVIKTTEPWTVQWSETLVSDEDHGWVAAQLKTYVKVPTLWEQAEKDSIIKPGENVPLVVQQTYMDCAVAKNIRATPWEGLIGLIGDDEVRRKIIQDSLGDMVMPEDDPNNESST